MTCFTVTWVPPSSTTSSRWWVCPCWPFGVLWRIRRGERAFPLAATIVIAGSAVIWTIVRNLPGFPLVPTILTQ